MENRKMKTIVSFVFASLALLAIPHAHASTLKPLPPRTDASGMGAPVERVEVIAPAQCEASPFRRAGHPALGRAHRCSRAIILQAKAPPGRPGLMRTMRASPAS